MNSKLKSNALLMAALAMSGQNFIASGSGDEEPVIYLPPKPVQPKGTKEYFFNAEGEFSTSHMLKAITVFRCFAVNDKNAIKKFNKWNKPPHQ